LPRYKYIRVERSGKESSELLVCAIEAAKMHTYKYEALNEIPPFDYCSLDCGMI